MAEVLIRQLVDDLDGKPIDTRSRFPIRALIIGLIYARLTPTRSKRRSPRSSSLRRESPLEARCVRQPRPHARRQGLVDQRNNCRQSGSGPARTASDVSPCGRIKADVVDAFDAAHRSLVSGIFSH